jgi:hypothetical protein
MKYLVLALLGTGLGIAGFVYAGIDDSPGGQLLAVAFIVGTIVLAARSYRRSQSTPDRGR